MKTRIPNLITVLIFTLITTLAWVGFTIYRAVLSKPAPTISKEISEELNPNLDGAAIEKLKGRISLP